MKKNLVRTLMAAWLVLLIVIIPMGALAVFTPSNGQDAALVLGQSNFTSNISATSQTRMSQPQDMSIGLYSDKVYVADTENHRVLRFSRVQDLFNGAPAEAVLGQLNFTSGAPNRGGTVAANTMNNPSSVCLDSNGRLWVADKGNNRVLRFDHASTKENGANADGVLGQADFAHSAPNRGGSVAANTLSSPYGVHVDHQGRLWVSDTDNIRILRFDRAVDKINGADADGVLGQQNFIDVTMGCKQSKMGRPVWVSGDNAGRLYVADQIYSRVLVFDTAAGLEYEANASRVIGQPSFDICYPMAGGVSAASFMSPMGVFHDPYGFLWIADQGNNRVLKYGRNVFLPVVRK